MKKKIIWLLFTAVLLASCQEKIPDEVRSLEKSYTQFDDYCSAGIGPGVSVTLSGNPAQYSTVGDDCAALKDAYTALPVVENQQKPSGLSSVFQLKCGSGDDSPYRGSTFYSDYRTLRITAGIMYDFMRIDYYSRYYTFPESDGRAFSNKIQAYFATLKWVSYNSASPSVPLR